MEIKKMMLSLTVIFCAILFSVQGVKAQDVQVNLHADPGYQNWNITFHNDSTNVDYYINTAYSTFNDGNDAHVGYIPEGSYTVSFGRYSYGPVESYFWFWVNDLDHDNSLITNNADYTMPSSVVITQTSGCYLVAFKD